MIGQQTSHGNQTDDPDNTADSGAAVITDYQQPDLKLDLFGGTTGTYAGMDRFGRTVDHRWYDYTSGTVDRARYYYRYDLNGNRQWQEDPVAAASMVNLDMLYAYDGLNRLTAYDRGDINGTRTAITTLAFAQDWELDQLNNWSGFDEDTIGNGTNDLVQARTHNDVNEITAITASVGANWVDPTYDAAGNMLTGPTPGAETSTQKYVYLCSCQPALRGFRLLDVARVGMPRQRGRAGGGAAGTISRA